MLSENKQINSHLSPIPQQLSITLRIKSKFILRPSTIWLLTSLPSRFPTMPTNRFAAMWHHRFSNTPGVFTILGLCSFYTLCLELFLQVVALAHSLTLFRPHYYLHRGFPGGSAGKNPPANAGSVGSIPGWRRSPGEGNGNPLHFACLGNPIDRGAWWATVLEVTRVGYSLVTKQQLSPSLYPLLGFIFHPCVCVLPNTSCLSQ